MVASALVVLVLLLPLGGQVGAALSAAAGWLLAVPIGGVLRGILIGVSLAAAVLAARTLLGIGSADE